MSSRNERATISSERGKEFYSRSKINSSIQALNKLPAGSKTVSNLITLRIIYFQIADATTLLPCKIKTEERKYRAFIAVIVNNIRLIDTISLN
jgi:pantoate--beta-alanine ligase